MTGRKRQNKRYENLTKRQKAWFDHYKAGNSQTEAARLAGYRFPEVSGYQNMINLEALLAEVKKSEQDERIASMDETRRFFTAVLRDETLNIKDRFRAGEILLKLDGAGKDKGQDEPRVEEIVVKLGEAEKYGE